MGRTRANSGCRWLEDGGHGKGSQAEVKAASEKRGCQWRVAKCTQLAFGIGTKQHKKKKQHLAGKSQMNEVTHGGGRVLEMNALRQRTAKEFLKKGLYVGKGRGGRRTEKKNL